MLVKCKTRARQESFYLWNEFPQILSQVGHTQHCLGKGRRKRLGLRKKAVLASAIVIVLLVNVYFLFFLPAGPAETYAEEKGLSNEVVEKLKVFDSDQTLNQSEIAFIDYLSGFKESLQQKIIDGFISDRKLSSQEAKQIDFLKQFPVEEQTKCIENGSFADLDWDGDNYSNYFEKFIAGTPYDVKNEVYVIFLSSAGPEYKPLTEMYDFLTGVAKIQEDHVHWFYLQNNNSTNLEVAINAVSQKATKNDAVLVILDGGGLEGTFNFYHGGTDAASYKSINDKLSTIDSRAMIIPIDACHSGSAIPYLESVSKPRIILTTCSAKEKSDFIFSYEFLQAFRNKSADKNGNGYVSVGEAADYAKRIMTFPTANPQISDTNNLGPNLYLIEFEVGK